MFLSKDQQKKQLPEFEARKQEEHEIKLKGEHANKAYYELQRMQLSLQTEMMQFLGQCTQNN